MKKRILVFYLGIFSFLAFYQYSQAGIIGDRFSSLAASCREIFTTHIGKAHTKKIGPFLYRIAPLDKHPGQYIFRIATLKRSDNLLPENTVPEEVTNLMLKAVQADQNFASFNPRSEDDVYRLSLEDAVLQNGGPAPVFRTCFSKAESILRISQKKPTLFNFLIKHAAETPWLYNHLDFLEGFSWDGMRNATKRSRHGEWALQFTEDNKITCTFSLGKWSPLLLLFSLHKAAQNKGLKIGLTFNKPLEKNIHFKHGTLVIKDLEFSSDTISFLAEIDRQRLIWTNNIGGQNSIELLIAELDFTMEESHPSHFQYILDRLPIKDRDHVALLKNLYFILNDIDFGKSAELTLP